MQKIVEKLKALFAISAQPVIGTENNRIVFANPPVYNILKRDVIGQDMKNILSNHIVDETAESFVSSGHLDGIPVSAAVTRFEGITVYSFIPKNDIPILSPSIAPFIASLRSSAFTIRLAADQITDRIEASDDKKLDAYISSLYRSYFSILRLTVNLDTAEHLAKGTLEFNPRMYDVASLISELISSLTHFMSADLDAEIVFSCKEPRVLAVVDSGRLEQLLLNLLSNSINHTSKDNRITVALYENDNNIIISVDDNGSGVQSDVLGNVFSRYSQPHALSDMTGDLGLGLFIARGIAELHGGALIIESRHNMGTSVRVMIPKNLDMNSGIREPRTPELDISVILREMSGVIRSNYYSKRYLD